MFKSGFAWVKINGCSYMCKIIQIMGEESNEEKDIKNNN